VGSKLGGSLCGGSSRVRRWGREQNRSTATSVAGLLTTCRPSTQVRRAPSASDTCRPAAYAWRVSIGMNAHYQTATVQVIHSNFDSIIIISI
jgi:hypothetical protein